MWLNPLNNALTAQYFRFSYKQLRFCIPQCFTVLLASGVLVLCFDQYRVRLKTKQMFRPQISFPFGKERLQIDDLIVSSFRVRLTTTISKNDHTTLDVSISLTVQSALQEGQEFYPFPKALILKWAWKPRQFIHTSLLEKWILLNVCICGTCSLSQIYLTSGL